MTALDLSDEMLSVVWSPEKHDPEWKYAFLQRLREVCASSDNVIGAWLCGQRALRKFSIKEMRLLESQLDSSTLRNTLRDVTIRARRFNPNLPIARVAIEVQRLPNPINPDLYSPHTLQASRALVESLDLAIRLDLDELTPHARVGILFLSAAYFGGLVDIPQLRALTLLELSRVRDIFGVPEARLRLSIRGQDDAEQRQWIPDPTTLALLSRCAPDLTALRSELIKKGAMLECIQQALSRAGMPFQMQPGSLTQLLELLRIQVQSFLPQLLVSYIRRSGFLTHPVKAECWLLIHRHSTQHEIEGRRSKKKHRHRRGEAEGPEWLRVLCRKIRKRQLSPVENVAPCINLEDLINNWAAFLLHRRSYYNSELQPKTVANYVRDVGRGLVDMLAVDSIHEVSPDALDELYEQMLESQPTPSIKRNLAKALLEFHGFLQKAFSYPPISPYAVLSLGKTTQAVDARIITEDQYRQVMHDLAVGPLAQRSPRLATIAQVMLIFGFRLGLRKNEELKLLRRDLQLPAIPSERAVAVRKRHPDLPLLSPERLHALELPLNLHIRPHYNRTLKNRNATRTLPLRVLLEPDELVLIENLALQRDEEEARSAYSDYLFCIPEMKTLWVSESILLPAIHDALRRVTCDGELHYHHLRHSCATWLTMKLATSAWGVTERVALLFSEHPRTLTWLTDSARLERAFFHSKKSATRKVIHITSAILGHSSPKISLLHYVHCMPWLAMLCWQWNPERWPPGHVIAKLAQVSLPTKPEHDHANRLSVEILHMQKIIGRIRAYKNSNSRNVMRLRTQAPSSVDEPAMGRITKIAAMLAYEAYAEASGFSLNLDWIEFPKSDRLAMLERARYIRSIGWHRLRGPVVANQLNPVELAPMPPKHGGVAGVSRYAEALYQVLAGNNGSKACRVLDDFVERCWASDTTLRFHRGSDEQEAREYLWLLGEIGINWRDIELIIYDPLKPGLTKAFWRNALGLPRAKFSEHRPENPNVQNGHIGIRVQLRLPSQGGQGEAMNHHSGSALRYLFLMASIDWHFRV